MHDPLGKAMSAAHGVLTGHLTVAAAAVQERVSPREVIQKTDAFLIQACRHVGAVCDVILPAARAQLTDGDERVQEYVQQARRLERAVAQTKRRIYGESHAITVPWSQVWSGLGREFRALDILENRIVADLIDGLDPTVRSTLADRVVDAEATSPTRPHPNAPHTGRFAHLSRTVLASTDSFWDAAEGRIVSGSDKIPTMSTPKRLAS